MIYRATFNDNNGSWLDDNSINALKIGLGDKGYRMGQIIREDECLSFYSKTAIKDVDLVLDTEPGQWRLIKVMD